MFHVKQIKNRLINYDIVWMRLPRAAGELPRADALRDLTEAFPPAGQGRLRQRCIARRKLFCIFEESPGIFFARNRFLFKNACTRHFLFFGTPCTVLSKEIARKTSRKFKYKRKDGTPTVFYEKKYTFPDNRF